MPVEIAGETYWTLTELLREFPKKLRPSEATLRRYIRTGKLLATKLGRGVLISSESVHRLLSGDVAATRSAAVTAESPRKPSRRLAGGKANFPRALAADCKRLKLSRRRPFRPKRALRT